jgi:tetratricopeptide (TPR) repeat protein
VIRAIKNGIFIGRGIIPTLVKHMEDWQRVLHERVQKLVRELQALSESSEGLQAGAPLLEALQVEEKLLRIYRKIERGVRKIANLLNDPSFYGEYSHLIHAMADMATIASIVVKQMSPALTMLSKGSTLQETLGIAENDMTSIYQLSKYLYEQQLYEESSGAFYLLSLLNPACSTFWIGLGNSEYFLGNYQEALLGFTFATQSEPENPLYHILLARCHRALGSESTAMACLGIAELCLKNSKEHGEMRKQIESLREDLQGRMP